LTMTESSRSVPSKIERTGLGIGRAGVSTAGQVR
jgi:hypothetical protein